MILDHFKLDKNNIEKIWLEIVYNIDNNTHNELKEWVENNLFRLINQFRDYYENEDKYWKINELNDDIERLHKDNCFLEEKIEELGAEVDKWKNHYFNLLEEKDVIRKNH